MNAAPQAATATYSLIHHTYDGRHETSREDFAGGWSESTASDAPPITARMEAALREQCVEKMRRKEARSVTWHHVDWNAWGAVTDLHRSGEHGEACALAKLLRWCDQRFSGRDWGQWEIRRDDLGEVA